jgi:hypothetical protein
MTRGRLLAVSCFVMFASAATAQTPADALKGTWVAAGRYCEESIVTVTDVEPSGTVRGSFFCKRTAWKPVMGDKIERNAVKGTLTGNRFVMENMEGGGFDVVLDGNTLRGTGMFKAGAERNPALYTRK